MADNSKSNLEIKERRALGFFLSMRSFHFVHHHAQHDFSTNWIFGVESHASVFPAVISAMLLFSSRSGWHAFSQNGLEQDLSRDKR